MTFQPPPQQNTQPYFQGGPQPAAPYAGFQPAPVKPPNAGLPIAVTVLSAVYVLLCLGELFALNHRVSVAHQVMNDPASVSVDQANSADNMVNLIGIVALVDFLALIVLLVIWQRSLRTALTPIGQYQQVLKASGYQIFRIVWLVSILLAVVLRGNSGDVLTAQDVISHDHQYMAYYGIRAALAGLLIYMALRLKRTSENAFAAAFSQAGYGVGAPVYPQF